MEMFTIPRRRQSQFVMCGLAFGRRAGTASGPDVLVNMPLEARLLSHCITWPSFKVVVGMHFALGGGGGKALARIGGPSLKLKLLLVLKYKNTCTLALEQIHCDPVISTPSQLPLVTFTSPVTLPLAQAPYPLPYPSSL